MKKLLMIVPLVILLCFTFSCRKQETEKSTKPQEKSVRFVCSESGWKIEGEKGIGKSPRGITYWHAFGKYDTGGEGLLTMSETKITYEESGNRYTIEVASWRAFEEGKGWITYRKATATGGVFGDEPQTCTYKH